MPVQIFEPFGREGTEEEQGLCYNPSLFSCLRKKSKILLPVEVYLQKKAIKKFNIPDYYRSSFTGRIKEWRQLKEGSGQNFAPTFLDFGPLQFYLARHFGFCYGVENAIEISYRALEENPAKDIFLLSEIIHNQQVNDDQQRRGVRHIFKTDGTPLYDFEKIKKEDVVIIPAFGTTVEMRKKLEAKGIEAQRYDTTCPFVEKVWNKAARLGKDGYTVIIHGKPEHEETRATFSHSESFPTVVVRNKKEAEILAAYIKGAPQQDFEKEFKGQFSSGFDVKKHLTRVGVVNQTTMLASETQGIANYFKQVMLEKFGDKNWKEHFADTRDTLCYATNNNQDATHALLEAPADAAFVVGGYNSSNTSHLAEVCEEKFRTFFIQSEKEIKSRLEINHYDIHSKKMRTSPLPAHQPLRIAITSGASCPDATVDKVIATLTGLFENAKTMDEAAEQFKS